MTLWWNGLSGLQQILAGVAIPATLILIIQTVMTMFAFGGDSDGDAFDLDGDGTIDDTSIGDVGLRMFTIRGFVAFFAVFGWSGVVMLDGAMHESLAFLLATLFGLLSMAFVALAFVFFSKMQANGTVDLQNAVGLNGSVYLTIPSQRQGTGKVSILVGGSLREYEAITDENSPIGDKTGVTVVSITGGNTLVVISK